MLAIQPTHGANLPINTNDRFDSKKSKSAWRDFITTIRHPINTLKEIYKDESSSPSKKRLCEFGIKSLIITRGLLKGAIYSLVAAALAAAVIGLIMSLVVSPFLIAGASLTAYCIVVGGFSLFAGLSVGKAIADDEYDITCKEFNEVNEFTKALKKEDELMKLPQSKDPICKKYSIRVEDFASATAQNSGPRKIDDPPPSYEEAVRL